MKIDIDLKDQDVSRDFAVKVGSRLKGGEVITFASDLGGGKTTLIKDIVKGTGSDDSVSSPTFTICNTYKAPKFTIFHFDFYRLNDPGVIARELCEVVGTKDSVVLIEWPEVIESVIPNDKVHIKIAVTGDTSRKLEISYPDKLSYLFEGVK